MSYEWVKWKRGGRYVDNDEGYHYAFCATCSKRTEHGITEGCIECANRDAARPLRKGHNK